MMHYHSQPQFLCWINRWLPGTLSLCFCSLLLSPPLWAQSAPLFSLPPVNQPTVSNAAHYSFLKEEEESDNLAKRVADLEEKYSELSEEHEETVKKLKHYAESGHSEATMKVNGRIHLDHWAFPGDSPGVNIFENNDPTISPQDRLGFRRVRFGVKGEQWRRLRP